MTPPSTPLAAALAPLRERTLLTPYPGTWGDPAADGVIGTDGTDGSDGTDGADGVVVARDGDLSRVVVDGAGVHLVDPAGSTLLATSVEALVARARHYAEALERAGEADPDDDAALERIAARALVAVRAADPGAPVDDDDPWAVALGEVADGSAAVRRPAPVPPEHGVQGVQGGERVLVALSDADRTRWFSAEQWKDLATRQPVTVVRAPGNLRAALDVLVQVARSRSQPEPRPTVLVTSADVTLDEDLLAALPALRLVCVLGAAADGGGAGAPVVAVGDGADVLAAVAAP
ncbi:hypothetical protein [Cellulomonas triticagri]|uniref:Uncharacterized protein n=1 Tax=Cellulomonas triticagri TaxID=2483352 RepID=A0A3M2J7Y2_9CELL|nr:hypothetical protein [Cellulomonas triticagri]RMI07045.1 hypothetical protein EBM89_14000 [Cellulomonas triticagri]